MKKKSQPIKLFLIIVLILGAGAFGAYHWFFYQLSPTHLGPASFEIPKNASLYSISETLKEKGYIRDARMFSLYLRYREVDRNIKAGEYSIEAYEGLDELIALLTTGQEKILQFTIPEGYTIRQIAKSLSSQGFLDEEEFLDLAKNPPKELIPFLGEDFPEDATLEGFLFPDTYRISRPDAYRVIETMVRQFDRVFTEEMQLRSRELGFSVFDLITLASVIEKETQYADEFPMVSSVFHNRIRDGWRLEACSTVEYVLEKESYVLTLEELKIDSPYNTYLYDGLPIGPIANPGLRAIQAALNPDKTPYYFFVAKGDGTHAFGRTLEEHNRNVRVYLP
jgi:UPF0755 protein